MERIEISGYKSIKELSLSLRPINILIGANGSGKSNFLSFFDFLKQAYNRNLQSYVALKGIDSFLHKGDKVTDTISCRLTIDKITEYSFAIKKGDVGFVYTNERINTGGNVAEQVLDIASIGPESTLRFETDARAIQVVNSIAHLWKYHFHDTGDHSPFNKEASVADDKFYLYEQGSNLGSFLYNIQNEHRSVYNLIVKTIQSIAPYFLDFFFRIEASGKIKLRWQSKYSSSVYGVNDMSDGTIRFVALTTLFLQPNLPSTIVIDEPELGLHPTAITKLAGLVKSAAAKGCQIILATQSTDLISHFEPEDIVTVDQINGESIFERLDPALLSIWLDDYSIDELWKRNIIQTGQPNL